MRPLRQLIRQPLKSLAGILLAALAVAILCISTAQTLAAANTVRKLNDIFVTVALPTAEAAGDGLLWAEEMAESHPEIFRGSYHHGLASAWIPDLTQDNYTQHLNKTGATNENYLYQSARTTATAAMFVITLTEANIEQSTDSTQIIGQLIGVVEEVIGLESGYYDPTGFTLRMSAANLTPEQLEALGSELIVGERYLVYGTDYQDLDWQLRSNMANIMVWREEKQLLEWELDQCTEKTDWNGRKTIRAKIGDLYHGLSDEELLMFRSAALTLSAPAASSPAIVRLTDTAEEFFSSADGALWKQALSDLNINCSTFPIIGVDNLSYLAGFATGKATISAGRSFTAAELTSGAKVCILSQSLAEANGLSVGDTIDPHFMKKLPLCPANGRSAAVMPGSA